jgi:peptidase C25-like protein
MEWTHGCLAALLLAQVPSEPAAPRPLFAVVAPAAWEPTLRPLLEARARELRVEFLPLEQVAGDPADGDAPERLKRELHGAWKERGLRYALLVGDADTLPVRFMVLDRNTAAAFDYAFYACDLYYADLADSSGAFDDWNRMREGFHERYFGEVRGEHFKDCPINYDAVSYVPEIAVGRWPVSDTVGLAALVAKTLAWKPSESPRALLVHADGWVDFRDRVRTLGRSLEGDGFAVEQQIYGEKEGVPAPAGVLRSLLSGADLALHAGHGSDESWAGCLGPAERDALAQARPSVYFSVGCSTAHFCCEAPYQAYLDEQRVAHAGTNAGEVFEGPPPPPACLQTGAYNSTGLGERLLRMPKGGAVAYIGCNTGAQPCAMSLMEGFVGALAGSESRRIGDAWRTAVEHYYAAESLATLKPNEDWYPPSIFFQGMKFMLLGDPTLELRAGPIR